MSRTQKRILPAHMGAGFIGAEVASWWALSPSLLPKPWWVTAANLAVLQAVGHAVATGIHTVLPTTSRQLSKIHITTGTITATTTAVGLIRHRTQIRLIGTKDIGPKDTIAGIVFGTLGYGALLIGGELTQHSINKVKRHIEKFLPPWISFIAAVAAITITTLTLADRVLLRRILHNSAIQAERLNRLVFPGTEQPWEPERSGSPWSYEKWGAVGSQGRAVLSGGPRKDDIITVTRLPAASVHEPIRIFIGKIPGRSISDQIKLVIQEIHRTGALRRDHIVINNSTGTGWITDWSAHTFEFLTGGNCATLSIQYSYLPSALSWYKDNDAPINAARLLIDALLHQLNLLPKASRPKLFLAGESLGAYGLVEVWGDVEKLLEVADGVLLSGTPRFSDSMNAFRARRDAGSSERLPVIDSGRHIRFAGNPDHLKMASTWEFPRMIVAQHASDPIVWWDAALFFRAPEWLKTPKQDHQDVFPRLRWVPFVTGWQVALDLLTSTAVPGGHGHNYHEEFIDYWAALLDRDVTPELRHAISYWIRANHIKR
ncbi:hypothetical protein N24_3020 [Corynebacterium suranareeae]|uniref:Uncharacterized protein n=2 Tax=Corynebacterium suranareeae TaxID=2506452 RepID=A0A169S8H1_9CORY|nr:alpha/beta-hydrolase family protein [Corynebacterium suranareeae]BAU97282.1 hypothetical protein N24_3020 [Corynebacterium suranareeae]